MPDASFEISADANLTLSMEGGVAGQVVNNLTTTDAGFALDARQGRILNETKLDKSAVDNSLTTTEAGRVLDARQGKWLAENKVGFGDVENTLNSTDSSRVLSAAQGKALNDRIDELYGMPDNFPAAKRDLSNVDVVKFYEKAAAAGVSLPIAAATSTDGVDYVVTVPGVKTIPRGYTFVLVPSVASTGTQLTLNVNGTGAKTIRRLLSSTSNNAVSTVAVGYFSATRPVIVQYDSYISAWVVVGGAKPSADDLHGTLPLAKGGTGATSADAARTAIGAVATNVPGTAWNWSPSDQTFYGYTTSENGERYQISANELRGVRVLKQGTDGKWVSHVQPILGGGTGATDAATACKNLGAATVLVGAEIPSNADLNDYTTPGTYRSQSGTISATLSNAPYTVTGFKLEVFNTTGPNQIIQEVKCNAGSARTYRRQASSSNNTWTFNSWYKVMQSAGDALAIGDGGTGATTAKGAEFNISGGISEATDSVFDSTSLVFARTSPSSTSGVFYKRSASKLWDYIAGKIRSVFGFSSSNVLPIANGGTGATTAAAARANIGAVAMQTATVTLAAASWSSLKQTVNVSGVTSNSTVIVTANPASHGEYVKCGAYCSAQGSGTLTFTATKSPTTAVKVNVLILK